MISLAETRFALRGLLRILRFDSSFVQFYDRSRSAAARSFWIYVPYIGLSLVEMLTQRDPGQLELTGRVWACFAITQVINVTYFPLILATVAQHIDRQSRVFGAIAIYNWLTLLDLIVGVPLFLLNWAGFDDNTMTILNVAALLLSLVCRGYALMVTLQISAFFAIAFVVLDFICGQLLYDIAHLISRGALF